MRSISGATYKTRFEAEETRRRKQKQFPNFYTKIIKIESGKNKGKYAVIVS